MRFCPNCQAGLDDGVQQCPRCGHGEGPSKDVDPIKQAKKMRELEQAGLGGEMVDLEGDGDTPWAFYLGAVAIVALALWLVLS